MLKKFVKKLLVVIIELKKSRSAELIDVRTGKGISLDYLMALVIGKIFEIMETALKKWLAKIS